MAVQLAVGSGGFLSGTTAARLYGLRRMPATPVEFTVDEGASERLPSWARLVRTSWEDGASRPDRVDGLSVASPLRMLFRLAAVFNQHRFERAAEDAWHLGLVDPPSAAAYLESIRRKGLTGVRRFEMWLERALVQSRPASTGLEQLVAMLCERAGLPEPERQYPLMLRSGRQVHLDLAWPDIRLAIEPGHSWWHGGDLATRADQARDRACAEVGWQVLRLDEHVRDDQDAVVEQLGRIYRTRFREVSAIERRF